MNTFMNGLQATTNFCTTENGALAHKSTLSKLYDMFAFGGAYRSRSDEDCILLFKNAYLENPTYALKCLFYIGDVRGGQGERRFFRVCYKWLAQNYPEAALRNLELIPEYKRWDDVLYVCAGTPCETAALEFVKGQLYLDLQSLTPSLCAKWMPSENASSIATKKMATKLREYMGMTHKDYRKMLSLLRAHINILERLMSEGRWDEIEFDKIPSKAGLKYRNAFAHKEVTAARYAAFMNSKETKVNASTLYPYEIVKSAIGCVAPWGRTDNSDRAAINKYWENQKDYLNGQPCKMMCVCDTSASMRSGMAGAAPIDVAIGLSMYCAERIGGPFKDHYISFSRNPRLVNIEGTDFVDKVKRIYGANLCENTDLVKTFNLLKQISLMANPEDRPDTLVVISDMEIDKGSCSSYWSARDGWTPENTLTEMEKVRLDWAAAGLEMPKLVYWNVDARQDRILDLGPNVSFVSGCSPVTFESIVSGKSGMDLMFDKLDSARYEAIR